VELGIGGDTTVGRVFRSVCFLVCPSLGRVDTLQLGRLFVLEIGRVLRFIFFFFWLLFVCLYLINEKRSIPFYLVIFAAKLDLCCSCDDFRVAENK